MISYSACYEKTIHSDNNNTVMYVTTKLGSKICSHLLIFRTFSDIHVLVFALR
jgi:hypothetical protein